MDSGATQINCIIINKNKIVNILFMAPRMVYSSIINLLWSLMSYMNKVRS